MREMYEGAAYAEKNPGWHEEDAPWKAGHIAEMIRANSVKCDTICEVGCGTGDILLNLEREFPDARLTGYEISPLAFERAQKKTSNRTSFHLEDVTKLQSLSFDVVLAIDVFEHVEDYISFLKSLKRIGRATIFHIPLDLSVQSVLRSSPIMRQREGVGHIHYFYKNTALATLEDCGYRILDWKYTASRLDLPNQAFTSKLMKFPRRVAYALHPDSAVRILGGYSLMVLAE